MLVLFLDFQGLGGKKKARGTFAKTLHECACRTSKIGLSLYQFFAQLSNHRYTIFERKAPILLKLGAFYHNLLNIHPIYVIWAHSSLMKTHRSLYQISRKSTPKGRYIYVHHVNPPWGKAIVCVIPVHCVQKKHLSVTFKTSDKTKTDLLTAI